MVTRFTPVLAKGGGLFGLLRAPFIGRHTKGFRPKVRLSLADKEKSRILGGGGGGGRGVPPPPPRGGGGGLKSFALKPPCAASFHLGDRKLIVLTDEKTMVSALYVRGDEVKLFPFVERRGGWGWGESSNVIQLPKLGR